MCSVMSVHVYEPQLAEIIRWAIYVSKRNQLGSLDLVEKKLNREEQSYRNSDHFSHLMHLMV